MSRVGEFALRLFTRHLGAKVLALLLAVGLFGFVQSSLSATQDVPRLVVQFVLAEELRSEYVLLTDDPILFSGLTLTGLRSKVDPQARALSDNAEVRFTIDRRFLKLHGDNADRIEITPELFRDNARFRDIVVGRLPTGASAARIELDRLETKTARIEVSADTKLVLPPNHEHQGTEKEGRLAISFNVKGPVTIIGPSRAFREGEPVIHVSVPALADRLSAYPIPGERGTARLSGLRIRWDEGRIDGALRGFLRILAPQEMGPDPISASDFEQRLECLLPLIKRKEEIEVPLPIQVRYRQPARYNLLADWDAFAKPITTADLDAGAINLLRIRLPRSLAESREFKENLVLVLNVAEAADPEETGDELRVPLYLDLRDRGRGRDLENLAQVEIVGERVAVFRKKRQ